MNFPKLFLTLSLLLVSVKTFSSETLLSYVDYQNPVLEQNIVFVHGTPGSSSAFKTYLEDPDMRKVASMISIDRLGFGKSSKEAVSSFEEHSLAIYETVSQVFKNKKVTCVGHSYGSPLCLDLMARYPDVFTKSVLIAGAFNHERKILRWYNKAARLWPVSAVLSRAFSNSNKEMYKLKEELRALSLKLPQIKNPVLILHGVKDRIVPFADSEWLYEKIKKNNILNDFNRYENDGHFIIWKNHESVKKEILNFIEKGL